MKAKLLEQASHEYKPNQRLAAVLSLAPLFLFVLPFVFVSLGGRLDRWLHTSPILYAPYNLILGGLLIVLGWLFAVWTIYSQLTLGRGTPVPLMATQKLIVEPPYTYCRNPMALGAMVMYQGVAILFRSIGAAILVLVFSILLVIYIIRFEEKEMTLRFGEEYLAYKHRTPFLIPRFWNKP